jgi:transposase
MALPPEIEGQIRQYYIAEKRSVGVIAAQLQVHDSVVRRVLTQAGLPWAKVLPRPAKIDAYLPFIRQTLANFPALSASQLYTLVCERGYTGSSSHFRHLVACFRPPFDASGWMLAVVQNMVDLEELKLQTDNPPGLEVLLHRLNTGSRFDRNKWLAILAFRRGLTIYTICNCLGISTNTYSRYKRLFVNGGVEELFAKRDHVAKKSDDTTLKNEIFKLLHEPPGNSGINRTTWTMQLLRRVLSERGHSASPEVIRNITRTAGYRWRKARVVLTSADPDYREKLDRIHAILGNLQSDEAFFSIDEYGPFAIKIHGGRKLTAPGEQSTVPQWQRSRGSLILTAAVELMSNHVTHFYSRAKNTEEMIRMMDYLVAKYSDRRRLYLSWDAASWHISKNLNRRIEKHNEHAVSHGGVIVDTAPLPSGAQFLNVIESIFSGMSRAVLHNSDYNSVEDAMSAIDKYFKDRNEHFQREPRPAGKKIWGKEREFAIFSEANNCKDPRYR